MPAAALIPSHPTPCGSRRREPEKPAATTDTTDATAATAAREKQLQDYRTTAQQQFATGQTRLAVSTIDRALGLDSNDTESRRLRDTFNKVEQAAAAAGAARLEAVNAEAPKRAPAVFADGDRLVRQARADRTGRRLDDALKDYEAAREAFSKATRDATDAAAAEAAALRARPEPPVKPESKPLVGPPVEGPLPPYRARYVRSDRPRGVQACRQIPDQGAGSASRGRQGSDQECAARLRERHGGKGFRGAAACSERFWLSSREPEEPVQSRTQPRGPRPGPG